MKKRHMRGYAYLCIAALLAGTMMTAAGAARPVRPEKIHGLANATFVWENKADEAVTEEAEEIVIGLPMLSQAVREHFGLDEGAPLTEEILAAVTGIRFELSVYNGSLPEEYADMTAVRCVINDGILPGAPGAGEHDAYGYEFVPTVVRTKYFDTSVIADEWSRMKFGAFFTVKDGSDPLLTPEGAAEMTQLFPNTAVSALAICDPMAKPRELRELGRIAAEAGLANTDTLITGTVIDLSDAGITLFPNLESLQFTDGLTPANEPSHLPVSTLTLGD